MTSAPAEHPDPTAVSTGDTDVLVIGGGPAGTTAATLPARPGAAWLRRRRQVGVAFSGDTLQAQAR